MNWKHHAELRRLFTDKEDYESIKQSMAAIADKIKTYPFFNEFDVEEFYVIPEDDDSLEYANDLLYDMWDFADSHAIWIEW